jgi:hypothetical protein
MLNKKLNAEKKGNYYEKANKGDPSFSEGFQMTDRPDETEVPVEVAVPKIQDNQKRQASRKQDVFISWGVNSAAVSEEIVSQRHRKVKGADYGQHVKCDQNQLRHLQRLRSSATHRA